MSKLERIVQAIGERQLVSLVLAPGFLALGVDAWVDHMADKPVSEQLQWVPVLLAPVAFVALLVAGIRAVHPAVARWLWRLTGAVSALTGAVGTVLHVKALLFNLKGEEITAKVIEEKLALSPPLFAPAAFLGLGVLLVVLASPRIALRFGAGSQPQPAPEPQPRISKAA